ncbi:MAG: sulfite reductase subunit alpha [Verrucomicrobia bacterium]|nr:sulfite reductase subunit alpha [Verrucomicrobiota bacterium]
MSTVPLIPDTAPFSAEQRAWLNGFLAGVFSRAPAANSDLRSPISASAALTPLTILFGSQTGTAEGLAKKAAKEAGKRSFAATVLDMAQTDLAKLAAEKNVLVIVSTYGDGEPPDSAKSLHTALASASGTALSSLRFSVCALGDTNYTQFCKCGTDFDHFLGKLGATRVTPRTDCDLDYEEKFNSWLNTTLTALGTGSAPAESKIENQKSKIPDSDPEPTYSKKNPYPALLLTSRNLNAPGSGKQVHHIEFDLANSGLAYEAGDALGVIPHNCPEHVAEVLAALGCDGEEAVPAPDGSTVPLRRALTEFYDLGKPTAELLARCAIPTTVSANSASTTTPASPHHVVDVLLQSKSENPHSKIPTPTELVWLLKRLQPRLYSISSSPHAHTGQVHLTVGAVRYEKDGRPRKGVCSTFLADRAQPGNTRIGVFVHSNKAFRPPASGDTPMIMVGPGTGIAPFRAFLAHRRATGAKGKNWLFFGDQRASTDFLYREELAALMHDGVLTKLDTAFSRDQAEKIYVQQRMLEAAAELYAWLEQGAHFYVCGDASRMAKDVDLALHQVIERAGGKTPEQAAAYVQQLKAAKRYARDVY